MAIGSDSSGSLLDTGARAMGPLVALDPRVRILAAPFFAVSVVTLSDTPALLAAVGVAFLVAALAGLRWRTVARRLLVVDMLMLFILASLPFSVPGTPILEWHGLVASAEGFEQAIHILLKANAILLASLGLVGALDGTTLGRSLARLRMPPALVHLLLFTVRYLDVIGREYARLRTAMRVRGFQPGNNWHTYRTLGYLVGMLLVRSLERSERILAAMRCRGFTGQILLLDTLRFRPIDALFAGLVILVCAALLSFDAWFGGFH